MAFLCHFYYMFVQPVYDTKKVIAILTYNQMPETDELRYDFSVFSEPELTFRFAICYC